MKSESLSIHIQNWQKSSYDRVVNATLSQGENLDELMMQFLRINSNVLVIDENDIG